MEVTKVTLDEVKNNERYVFYFAVENVALFALLHYKYSGTIYPSLKELPMFSVKQISLLGAYSNTLKKYYKTHELHCNAEGVDVYKFELNILELPEEINRLIQSYL